MLKILNNTITIAKLLPLLFFIGVGVFYIKQADFLVPLPPIETKSVGAALLLIFYAFSGFESLVMPASEMRNPEKNLPIAVMATIVICGSLYFLVQLIAIGTLGPALATSVSPITDVAEMILGPSGKLAVTLAMLVSIGGISFASSFIVPRIGGALAADGMIPSFIGRKNRFGSSYVSILITIFATCVIALSGNFVQLAIISAVSRFAQHISTCLAVYVFYQERLTLKQPIIKSLSMLIPLIALSGISWLLYQTPIAQLVYGGVALLIGVPLYFLCGPAKSAVKQLDEAQTVQVK